MDGDSETDRQTEIEKERWSEGERERKGGGRGRERGGFCDGIRFICALLKLSGIS